MIIRQLPILLFQTLLFTIFVEVLVAFLIGIREKKDFILIVLMNMITNPLLNVIQVYIGYTHGMKAQKIAMILLEITAFLTEGWLMTRYLKTKKINGFLFSLLLNVFSYLAGEWFAHSGTTILVRIVNIILE